MAAKKEIKDAMAVINKHIETGEFSRIYLLFGDERYLVNQYKNKLLGALTSKDDTLNFMKFSGNSINTSELIDFCNEMPFFADRRVALVENSGLFKSSNEELAKKLANIPETSVVIFVEMETDSRYKLYKTVDKEGEALQFVTPNEKMLVAWIKGLFKEGQVRVTETAIYKIMEVADMDMNRIKNEVDKLISYVADTKLVDIDQVDALCNQSAESRVFQMIDNIIAGQRERAVKMYHDLLDNKESVIMINACLIKQFNRLLLTKLAISKNTPDAQVAKITGSPVWALKNLKAQCRKYKEKDLKNILDRCQEFDYKAKTGQLTDEVDMETMIVELCGQR